MTNQTLSISYEYQGISVTFKDQDAKKEFEFLIEICQEVGIDEPNIQTIHQYFTENPNTIEETNELILYTHLMIETLALKELHLGDTLGLTLDNVNAEYQQKRGDLMNSIKDIKKKKSDKFEELFIKFDRSHYLPVDPTDYDICLNYKETRELYELVQHAFHMDPGRKLDQAFDATFQLGDLYIYSFSGKPYNPLYMRFYKAFIQQSWGELNKQVLISLLNTDAIFEVCDALNSKISRTIIYENKGTNEQRQFRFLPKERMDIRADDYISLAGAEQDGAMYVLNNLKGILTVLQNLEKNHENVQTLFTVALIKYIHFENKNWFDPSVFSKYLNILLTDCEKFNVTNYNDLVYGDKWDETRNFILQKVLLWNNEQDQWTFKAQLRQKVIHSMARQKDIKDLCEKLLMEKLTLECTPISPDNVQDQMKMLEEIVDKKGVDIDDRYTTICTMLIQEIAEINPERGAALMKGSTDERNVALLHLNIWYVIQDYIHNTTTPEDIRIKNCVEQFRQYPYSSKAIENIMNSYNKNDKNQAYRRIIGETAYNLCLMKAYTGEIGLDKVIDLLPQMFSNLDKDIKQELQTFLSSEPNLDQDQTLFMIANDKLWETQVSMEELYANNPDIINMMHKQWIAEKIKKREKIWLDEAKAEEQEIQNEAENQEILEEGVQPIQLPEQELNQGSTDQERGNNDNQWERFLAQTRIEQRDTWQRYLQVLQDENPFFNKDNIEINQFMSIIDREFHNINMNSIKQPSEITAQLTKAYPEMYWIIMIEYMRAYLKWSLGTNDQITDQESVDELNGRGFTEQSERSVNQMRNEWNGQLNDLKGKLGKLWEIGSQHENLGPDKDSWINQMVYQEYPTKNALREFIDTKTFQNEFYHDFQEYGNKTYAEIRRVLGAFNFSEKYIQELAHQYWTNDDEFNDRNTRSRRDKMENKFNKEGGVKSQIQNEFRRWSTIKNNRMETITITIENLVRAERITQNDMNSERTRLIENYVNGDNLRNEQKGEELQNIKEDSQDYLDHHNEQAITQRIRQLYDNNGIVSTDEEIRTKYAEYLSSQNKDSYLSELGRELLQRRNSAVTNWIQRFNNEIGTKIENINFIHGIVSSVEKVNLTAVKQSFINQVQSTPQNGENLFNELKNDMESREANAKDQQINHYGNQIHRLISNSGRPFTVEGIRDTEVKPILDIENIQERDRKFNEWVRNWETKEQLIQTKIQNLERTYVQKYQITNKEIDSASILQHILNKVATTYNQDTVLSNINEKIERNTEIVKTLKERLELNKLEDTFREAYGQEFTQAKWYDMIREHSNLPIDQQINVIKAHIQQKNRETGNLIQNVNNKLTECFQSAFPDFDNSYINEKVIELLFRSYPEVNRNYSQLEAKLQSLLPQFKKMGELFRKWNSQNISNIYLGMKTFQDAGHEVPRLFELAEEYEVRLEIIEYNPLNLLKITNEPENQQNQKMREELELLKQKRNAILSDSNFRLKIDQYCQGRNSVEKETLIKEIVGHCDRVEDVDKFIDAKTRYIGFGKNWSQFQTRVDFDNFYKSNRESSNLNLLMRSNFGQMSPEDNIKIDELKVYLSNTYPDIFPQSEWSYIQEDKFEEDGAKFYAYLQGEMMYQQIRLMYPPNTMPATWDHAQYHSNIFKALDKLQKEFLRKEPLYRSIKTDRNFNLALNEYNEIAPDHEKLTAERIFATARPTDDILKLTQSLRNQIQSKINSVEFNDSLERAIREVWKPHFPNDFKSAEDWRTEFGDNYKARNAILKLTPGYQFWANVNPHEEVNLKNYIVRNGGTIESAYQALNNFYSQYYPIYSRQWVGNPTLLPYLTKYKNKFGGSEQSALYYLFGKFYGDLNRCLQFFAAYEGNQEIENMNGSQKYSDINSFLQTVVNQGDAVNQSTFLNNIQSSVTNFSNSKSNWESNTDFRNHVFYLEALKEENKTGLKYDFSWDEDKMYKNYLIPLAKKYYQQFVGKRYIPDSNTNNSNVSTEYNNIILAAEDYRKKNDDWENSNVKSTLERYQNEGRINSKKSYEDLKDEFEKPADAMKYLEIEKNKKTLLVALGRNEDEELPRGDVNFAPYHDIDEKDLTSRLNWLLNFVSKIEDENTASWNSPAFLKIHSDYRSNHSDDRSTQTINQCKIKYGLDYESAKIDLKYHYLLEKYREEFQEDYSIKETDPNNDQKLAHIHEIEKLLKNYKDYKVDNELQIKLNCYNAESGQDTLNHLWLVKKFKDNVQSAKIYLEYWTYVGKINAITSDNNDIKDVPISLAGITKLKEIFNNVSKDDTAFQSVSFQQLLNQYNDIKHSHYDATDIKRLYGSYINCTNAMKCVLLEHELETTYQLSKENFPKNFDGKWETYLKALENKKSEIDIKKNSILWDSEVRKWYDYAKENVDSTLPTIEQMMIDDKYNKDIVYYKILTKIWGKFTGKEYPNFETNYQVTNAKLANKINNYIKRYEKFRIDGDIQRLLVNQKQEVSIDDLFNRYIDSDNPDDDVLDARRYLQNEIWESEYKAFCEEVGLKPDTKMNTFKNEKERYKFFDLKMKETRDIKPKWEKLMPEVEHWNRYQEPKDQLHKWEEVHKKYDGNIDKVYEEIVFENRKKKFEEDFPDDTWSSKLSKKDQIEKLDEFFRIYNTYYYTLPNFKNTLDEYNRRFNTEKLSVQDIVTKYKTDSTGCLNMMNYKILKLKLQKLDKDFNEKDYGENSEDISKMQRELERYETNQNQLKTSTNINGLYNEYEDKYKDTAKKLEDIEKEQKYKVNNVLNFLKIMIKIKDLETKYKKVFNYEDRKSWGSTPSAQFEYLEKIEKRYQKEKEKLDSFRGIDKLVDLYNDSHGLTGDNVKSIDDIFAENEYHCYKTYQTLLLTKYNYLNPKAPKDDSYTGSPKKFCEELEKEISEIERVYDKFKGKDGWMKLSLDEREKIIQNYKDEDTGNYKIELQGELQKYKKIFNLDFPIDSTIKQWNKEGRDIKYLKNYLAYVNKYSENNEYHELINKYNSKNKDKPIPAEYFTPYDKMKYATLEPLRQRYETAFGMDITINQMMQYAKYLKTTYGVNWRVQDENLDFDFNIAKIANKANIVWREYENYLGHTKKNRVDFDTAIKSYKTQNGIGTLTIQDMKQFIKEVKDLSKKSKTDSKNKLIDSIDSINKNKDKDHQISTDMLEKLSVNSDNLDALQTIIEFIPDYENHFNKKVNPNDLNSFHEDPKNPNWIHVLEKIAFLPLIDDHNSIEKKNGKMSRDSVESVVKKYILNKDPTNPLKDSDVKIDHIRPAYEEYKKEVTKEKEEYFKTMLSEYHKHTDDSSETYQNLVQLYPNLDDLERYLKLNRYIFKTNKIYKQLKEHYKKEHTPLKYSDYQDKPVNNLEPTIIILQNLEKEAQKEWDEEKKKDDKEKEHKKKVELKLSDLNSMRRKVGLTEIGFERYKNMETDTALSDINNMMNEARQKESEKNSNNNTSVGIGGALRNNFIGTTMNKPAATTTPATTTTTTTTTTDTNTMPTINDGSEKKEESVWSKNYEGGITSLIQQSAKGISIRSLLMEQQKKNKLNGKTSIMSQFNENAPPKPVVPYSSNSNTNNLFSSKTTMTEEKETPIEKKPIVSPISEKPMTLTKIEPGKKINLLPTKVDQPEVVKTKNNMIQVLPRRGRKNLPLRFKAKEEMEQQQKAIEKVEEESEEVEIKPKKPTMNTKAKSSKQFKKQKSERTKLLKKNSKAKKKKDDDDEVISEKSTIDKEDISKKKTKTKPLQRKVDAIVPKPTITPIPESIPKTIPESIPKTITEEKPATEVKQIPKTSEIPSVIQNNPQLMKYFK